MYHLSISVFDKNQLFVHTGYYNKLGFPLLCRLVKAIASEAMAEGGRIRTLIYRYGD